MCVERKLFVILVPRLETRTIHRIVLVAAFSRCEISLKDIPVASRKRNLRHSLTFRSLYGSRTALTTLHIKCDNGLRCFCSRFLEHNTLTLGPISILGYFDGVRFTRFQRHTVDGQCVCSTGIKCAQRITIDDKIHLTAILLIPHHIIISTLAHIDIVINNGTFAVVVIPMPIHMFAVTAEFYKVAVFVYQHIGTIVLYKVTRIVRFGGQIGTQSIINMVQIIVRSHSLRCIRAIYFYCTIRKTLGIHTRADKQQRCRKRKEETLFHG